MRVLNWMKSLFTIRKDNLQLMRVQVHALSRHIPLMYFVLITNTVALSFTHIANSPIELTVLFPGLLVAIACVRLLRWWRTRGDEPTAEQAYGKLRGSIIFAVALGVLFTANALSLYAYGDISAKAHVAFYVSVTVIACMFCLTTLRPAALVLTLVVVAPSLLFFVTSGNLVFIAMAINLLLVCGALTVVLFYNFEHFTRSVVAQQQLTQSNAEMAALSAENVRLANLDSLTGLPNRRRFFAELDIAIERHQEGHPVTVGIVDLDGFKPVNDLYGHAVGDKVLVEVGRRLQALASSDTFLARLGGDEFVYILNGDRSDDGIRACGRKICDALGAPYTVGEIVVQLSGTVGFARGSAIGVGAASLLECADYALYDAKHSAPGTAQLFSAELQTRLRHHSLVEQALRHPDLPNQLSLAYQPIFDVQAGRPIGFEALARWKSPTLGQVPPDVFIHVAERTGLIHGVTETLLARALEELKRWPGGLRLSFNLSMHDIASPEAVARIVTILETSGVDARRIDFEITETAVMRDFDQSHAALLTLRALGARIALDDFGSGYSSLSYVHRLPLDKIKIDRGFIAEIEDREASRNIVRSVLDLCRNLNLDCVVEGTETAGQVAILTQLGCRYMQGYFISRPMPSDSIAAFLDLHRPVLRGVG